MYLQQTKTKGPAGSKDRPQVSKQQSSSLPFGQALPLTSIGGPTYLTAQTLIQQVAYTLSDRLWAFSPETFDLDIAAKDWFGRGLHNARGYPTNVESMEIRQGAASITLGYMFSKDFDLKKRYIPQSMLAPAAALRYLHTALDQLSLLYTVANPFVAHIAAVDYSSTGLVTDYVSTMTFADELGFAVVSSFSAYETQHLSLLATLLASLAPTIHTYDGISIGRETTRIIDVINQAGLESTYKTVLQEVSTSGKRNEDLDAKVVRLLKSFNGELGTTYGLFEYQGHTTPHSVLVVFGTIESSLASQVASSLVESGARIGVLNVRVYRPFVEEEFLRAIPKSVKVIGVLGQVHDNHGVSDSSVYSILHGDVMAAVTFSDRWSQPPTVLDIKYPRERVWSPVLMAAVFQLFMEKPILQQNHKTEISQFASQLQLVDPTNIQQYTFWDINDSPSAFAPMILGQALSIDSANNITIKTGHDNLIQGGILRTDIRKSKKTVEASYSIESADVVFVGAESLFRSIDVLDGLTVGGSIIVKLPGVQNAELENKLPVHFRKGLFSKSAHLYVLDTSALEAVANDPPMETFLVQLAFLRVSLSDLEKVSIQRLASVTGATEILDVLAKDIGKALRQVEIPESWAVEELEKDVQPLPSDINVSSFTGFEKDESELPGFLKGWKTVAKSLVFKEAYGTKTVLRPDVSLKTYTVQVKENRRLTPLSYERNIFHIEFDLGNSGMKYDIGEALGIHAENDEFEVEEFIKFYKLNADDVVEIPSRDNPNLLENRTVYQALMQNVDIFGRPPKRFYEALSKFADDPNEKKELLTLGGPEGATEFKRRAEVDTITYADILLEFSSAHPSFHDIVSIVNPMKRREYSIASCQKVTPNTVALMIVVVGWVDPKGRDRFGQATRFLNKLKLGATVTVSVKPSVMKLPTKSTQPLIMAGLGTGLAPFRAFVQHRAWEMAQGKDIGAVLLYMGSRHQREEYCYGEEWEAYRDAGVITLLGRAFSRDQPQKIYIQDRMRQTMKEIIQAYLKDDGAFYLCGPTWPVPDVTNVLEDAIALDAKALGKRIDPKSEIERLKDQARYVLEVY